jgi:alkaline phosphatase
MVEGGQIDWAAHANDAENVINDVIGFDDAVLLGLNYGSSNPNALIIVTADHETGGMTVGFESSGEDDEDGPFSMPDETLFYVNWESTGHTGADVLTTADGYLASRLTGTYENTYLYDVMHSVFGWGVSLPIILR